MGRIGQMGRMGGEMNDPRSASAATAETGLLSRIIMRPFHETVNGKSIDGAASRPWTHSLALWDNWQKSSKRPCL